MALWHCLWTKQTVTDQSSVILVFVFQNRSPTRLETLGSLVDTAPPGCTKTTDQAESQVGGRVLRCATVATLYSCSSPQLCSRSADSVTLIWRIFLLIWNLHSFVRFLGFHCSNTFFLFQIQAHTIWLLLLWKIQDTLYFVFIYKFPWNSCVSLKRDKTCFSIKKGKIGWAWFSIRSSYIALGFRHLVLLTR